MKRALAALPLLLFVASSAAAAAETRLALFGNRLFVTARVNGIAVEALLDSGAEMSVIDDDFARRLPVRYGSDQLVTGSGGEQSGRFAHGLSIAAAGLRLRNATAVVLDLDDLSKRLVGRPVALILGREIFDKARLRIDIERGTIAAVPRSRRPRGQRLPLATARGVETMPASIEGLPPAAAEFDLGNGSEVLVGRAYAERTGLLAPDRVVGRADGGGIGGRISREVVMLRTLTLAGRTFENVRAAIDPTGTAPDLNVGTSILRHFIITADFAEHALWLEPRPPRASRR